MKEQLFTATGEAKDSGKERAEQLFTRSEKRNDEETKMERIGALKGRVYSEKSRGVISAKARIQEWRTRARVAACDPCSKYGTDLFGMT
jgi:hypothetical protein